MAAYDCRHKCDSPYRIVDGVKIRTIGRVYNKGKIANVEELRQRMVDEWKRLDQRIIDGALKEW